MTITRALILLIMVFGIGAVAATNLQQAYAARQCPGCAEFKQVFHEFVRDVVKIFYNNGVKDVGEFKHLSAQFERVMIQAVIDDHAIPGVPVIPDLVNKYEESVGILLGKGVEPGEPIEDLPFLHKLVVDLRLDVLCIFFRDCPPR